MKKKKEKKMIIFESYIFTARPVALAKLSVPTHTPFLVSSPVALKFFNALVLNIAEKMLAGR
jgi:hypothetical protein